MKKRAHLLFVLIGCLLCSQLQASYAQQAQGQQPIVLQTAQGLSISWESLALTGTDPLGGPVIEGWQNQQRGAYRLPTTLLTVELGDRSKPAITVDQLESRPWTMALTALPGEVPRTLMGEERPDLQQVQAQLPTAAVTVLRQSFVQGRSIAVLAIGPLFDAGQGPQLAHRLHVTLPGVQLIDPAQLQQEIGRPEAQLSARSLSITAPEPLVAPRQALAQIRVQQRGMAHISAASLSQAGINLADLTTGTIQLWHNDVQVAIEILGDVDGKLGAQGEIRFFVPDAGDRWNKDAVYWLVQGSAPGQPISKRTATPGSAPISTVALEQGLWRIQRRYDSLLPGPLGDYWYFADLRTGPQMVTATTSLVLTPTLPLAAGPITLTLYATGYTQGAHNLQLQLGNLTQNVSGWSGNGSWSRDLQFPNQDQQLTIRLIPASVNDGVELQAVAYTRPVELSTQGNGALFSGYADARHYQISGATAESALYDVSNPSNPVRLQGQYAAGQYSFEDQGAHAYVLTGNQSIHDASVSKHAPVDMRTDLKLQAIYIAPASLHAALAPLIDYRNGHGVRAGVVDVQQLYDAWSGGHVSPNAIRDFLRYAHATWAVPPQAAILVGDGSADPFDYLRRGAKNVNLMPPYLAHVDPWIGETACDLCYVQLDGVSPLDDLLPDMMVGRFPVKSSAELTLLVNKILRYEQAPDNPSWQSHIGLVADNYYKKEDGSFDLAGDFASMGDAIANRVPAGVSIDRLYYDPSPTRPADQPWREADENKAHQRTIDLINRGAALITYIGHSHQWQWAVTNPQSETSTYLLGLYDADLLTNSNRLAVIRELTCLTSAFQTPAFEGTTIDERLLLMPGGAAAVWGSSGLSVAHGHDALALGFDRALWQANGKNQALGSLTRAGLMELYSSTSCCNDIFRTYILLGDPLTQLRFARTAEIYLPQVHR